MPSVLPVDELAGKGDVLLGFLDDEAHRLNLHRMDDDVGLFVDLIRVDVGDALDLYVDSPRFPQGVSCAAYLLRGARRFSFRQRWLTEKIIPLPSQVVEFSLMAMPFPQSGQDITIAVTGSILCQITSLPDRHVF